MTCLSKEFADFIQQGVAAAASSCNAELLPSMARVVACRVAADQRITILLSKSLNTVFIQDVLAQQKIAVVFCLPSTERAIQIKGETIQLEPVLTTDWALVQQHDQDFADQITPKGYPREFATIYHHIVESDLFALSFAANGVFEQTPGPQAGQCIV